MRDTSIEQEAHQTFESGFHCAESIFSALLNHFPTDMPPTVVRCASAFCGGIGKSREEACGALTGGVMAIGALFGRTTAGADIDRAWRTAADFRRRFLESFGATRCGQLMDDFGEQENLGRCKQMTARATGMLKDLIERELVHSP